MSLHKKINISDLCAFLKNNVPQINLTIYTGSKGGLLDILTKNVNTV